MNIGKVTRENQLQDLREFISSSRQKILEIISELKWDPNSLVKHKEMVNCPFDDGHVIPKDSLQDHVEKCRYRKQGYDDEDIPFPPLPVDPDSPTVLNVDSKLQASILKQAKEKNPAMLIGFPGEEDSREVPLSSDRLMSSLTSDERAALHSYVISKTVSPGETKEISLAEQDLEINFKNKKETKKDKTPLERLIEERDAKRRKEGKKVHINRKSHTEIIREVIENQMEIYVEWLKDENLLKEEESETVKEVALSSHSYEEDKKASEKDEENSVSSSKGHPKSWDMPGMKEKPRDSRHRRDERNEFDYYDDRWQNDKEMENTKRSYHSREMQSKRYKDYEGTSYREYEYKEYKERDYDKHGRKHHREERKYKYEKVKMSKYGEYRNWSDCTYTAEEEVGEHDSGGGISRKTRYTGHGENRVHRKEKRHHKSKRHHHSSDSESDYKSKHRKKEKHHKRDD